MKITGIAIRIGIIAAVLMMFTVSLFVVFGQMRFNRTNTYIAQFSNISGLQTGQFVRASGVEIGKVRRIQLINGGQAVRVEISVDRSLPIYQSTTAHIGYADLIGNRYIELKRGSGQGENQILPNGGFIPESHTSPALDLDALIGGFKPLFRALDPEKVNTITRSLVTVFQGQGGTINNILDQVGQFSAQIADRDQAIGQIVTNLNTVLNTTVAHQQDFDTTVDNFEQLITGLNQHSDQLAIGTAHISSGAGTVAELLADNRELVHKMLPYVETTNQALVDKTSDLEWDITTLPKAVRMIGRTFSYGDFVNFYMCDVSIKLPGLQPGGPVRLVRIWQQPSGRCTPE